MCDRCGMSWPLDRLVDGILEGSSGSIGLLYIYTAITMGHLYTFILYKDCMNIICTCCFIKKNESIKKVLCIYRHYCIFCSIS